MRVKRELSRSEKVIGGKISKAVEDWIAEVSSKPKFASLMKMSRGTLYTRLREHNWTETEIFLLKEKGII